MADVDVFLVEQIVTTEPSERFPSSLGSVVTKGCIPMDLSKADIF